MRKILVTIAMLCLSVSAARCSPAGPPVDPSHVKATCAEACTNARKRCDPEVLKPKGAATCEDACTNAASNAVAFNTGCIASAPSCDAVRLCASAPTH